MLSPGNALGIYDIVSPLGAGGMGEVYRARDTKLGRDVAIKILPPEFAGDPERLARFQREAQALAALNHPHVAQIYGLERPAGRDGHETLVLVMELVEGESLAQKLDAGRGEGLGIRESLATARQIVDALEAAHDKGIVHRDLKPANIMVTHDGQVKVLDFGLARIDAASSGAGGSGGALTHSPTLTFAATQAGVILGTAAYMSPEQAKGRVADKRSDVWAFGCVLFEMLTGKRAFDGDDVSDMLAAILRGEPDWTALPTDTPASVCAVIQRCLAKDRKARIPDFAVVRFMLDDPPAPPTIAIGSSTTVRSMGTLRVWQAAAAFFLLTTVMVIGGWYQSRLKIVPVTRFFVAPPDNGTFVVTGRPGAAAAISPDGSRLAFTARDAAGKVMLWVRPLDSLTAQPLLGSDDAAWPFWSPDSRLIGYSTRGKLMKIAASGGPPQMLCPFSGPSVVGRGGTWNRDGTIVFDNGPAQPLSRVSASGGQPSPVGRIMARQLFADFPSFLPDQRHVLFHLMSSSDELSGVYVVSIDSGEAKRITGADTGAIYSVQDGHLLFVRQGTLLAQSFDAKNLTVSSDPFLVAERVESAVLPGMLGFSVSDTGVLAYGVGAGATAGYQLAWLDRGGKLLNVIGPEANYQGIALAPDGKRVAAHRHEQDGGDIWVTDLARGTTSRFTFDASQDNSSPVWSPDGTSIAFASNRGGKWGLYQRPANNAGGEEQILEPGLPKRPVSWAPDGRSIVFTVLDPKTLQDIWMIPLSGARKPVPWAQTAFNENQGQISPDGHWIAYQSNETGRLEVYVQPFPSGAGKWQVSTDGGGFPLWRRDGRELFYSNLSAKLIATDVNLQAATFEAGSPMPLFDLEIATTNSVGIGSHPYSSYAVSLDGQRVLVPRRSRNASSTLSAPIAIVTNWIEGLRK